MVKHEKRSLHDELQAPPKTACLASLWIHEDSQEMTCGRCNWLLCAIWNKEKGMEGAQSISDCDGCCPGVLTDS